MNDSDLLKALGYLRDTMRSVATGGHRIDDVNEEFQDGYARVAAALRQRGIANPLPYANLWEWYDRWSSGDMPSYQSRRTFINELFTPLVARIRTGQTESFEPTGWTRVDRTIGKVRELLASATAEEQFQAVGLLCREALISLAQAVYKPESHPILDGAAVSSTDAQRMLEAFIAVEFGGGSNDEARKHIRSALALALNLQHRRTAGFRNAAMCVEATAAVINIVAIVSGRRDPQRPHGEPSWDLK
jgi:hypothetical protein